MPKILPYDYKPSTPPGNFKQWPRWITEELYRISRRLVDNPVLLSVVEPTGVVDVSPVLEGKQVMVGIDATIDHPAGNWSASLGRWICPLDGVYSTSATARVEPFGTGNKAWEAYIRIYVGGVLQFEQGGSGVDDVPLFVNFNIPVIFEAGQEITFELWTIHAQFTGTTGYEFRAGLTRLSAAL